MMAVTSFGVEMTNFLAAGYDVIIPNYRGSLSFGKGFLEALVGNAGIIDVQDCHDCVMLAKQMVNPTITIAYGGSHGGFLTAWLLGRSDMNSEYAAGVLWNPAVDLISSNLTSDIPEWALSQVLSSDQCRSESPFAPSFDFMKLAYQQSPISHVKNVKVPSLVLLGSADKRVVPCGGLRWAQAVEANKAAKVDVMWFPDQGHAISGPEFYETAIVSIANWIQRVIESHV
jgi:acylaminoacyl-peptidase